MPIWWWRICSEASVWVTGSKGDKTKMTQKQVLLLNGKNSREVLYYFNIKVLD